MRVDIDSEYWVGIDEYNHTLYKHNPGGYEFKEKKSGEIKTKGATDEAIGYYPNMRQCITRVIELKMIEGEQVVTLAAYLDTLEELIKDLQGKITE